MPASKLKTFVKSVWFFPWALALPFLILVLFQINGSSIGGSYHEALYGKTKDPNLLLNQPQPIRSDEWLVTTQLTLAQHAAGYPRVNPNIDAGRDMSVVGDAPYKDWSSVFKPQNLAFFVLPLGFAFAFKWWLLLYLTIISCYFVVLRFFPGKRLFSALLSIAIGCSPLLFWWYSTGTLAPVFYGFFIILLGMRIIKAEGLGIFRGHLDKYSRSIYALTLAYLLTCFALILYPPFQVPIALAVTALLAGTYLDKYGLGKKLLSRDSLAKLGVFASGSVLALAIVFAFIHTRADVIATIRHTVYPGARDFSAGGSPLHELFTTYLQPQLQRISRAANYYTNQSEASQFILLLPFLIIPGFALLVSEYRSSRKLNWPLLMVQLCAMLFMFDLFVPGLHLLYKVTLLSQVQHGRMYIGLGFLGVIQLLLILQSLQKLKLKQRRLDLLAAVYAFACLIILIWAGLFTREHYPKFVHSLVLIGAAALFFDIILFCFLSRRLRLGVVLLLILTFASVFHVHPLYRGLGPIYNGDLSKTIDRVSKPGDAWVNLDNLIYENVAIASGRDSLSGVKPYPSLSFWRQVEGPRGDRVYNRYAHVLFSSDPTLKENLHLIGPDSFEVKFACTPFIEKHVQYAMAVHSLNYPCVSEVAEIHYPTTTFYLYKIH